MTLTLRTGSCVLPDPIPEPDFSDFISVKGRTHPKAHNEVNRFNFTLRGQSGFHPFSRRIFKDNVGTKSLKNLYADGSVSRSFISHTPCLYFFLRSKISSTAVKQDFLEAEPYYDQSTVPGKASRRRCRFGLPDLT